MKKLVIATILAAFAVAAQAQTITVTNPPGFQALETVKKETLPEPRLVEEVPVPGTDLVRMEFETWLSPISIEREVCFRNPIGFHYCPGRRVIFLTTQK